MNLSESYKYRLQELAGLNNIYYHGSCYDFDKFENIGNNASRTVFGNKLSVQGNFITKDKEFAKVFTNPDTHKGCFMYIVKLLSDNIFDLKKPEHYKLYEIFLNSDEFPIEDYEQEEMEEYIANELPTWDNYPIIEFVKAKGFDGIKLAEFDGNRGHVAIESIMVFDPSLLKIIKKQKV